ncbi:XK-related protein 4-like [Eriocheir sinensis]|uniref:XK-related protein 4-like n=1 Tax=Eriocheir sinensis TaxID=95602 RepID=UPI0021C89600|nr:XK-related protein 4-like [Eriocheir sinensis]XP_050735670.1 XK-related protein 4-like [Eriocheir sinensis]XP_050735671.1 XK-related protein 4-like [Eriocheir sinensis]XP_050735672.1 XK-related protein 4-like [Eriocheir sinensis]XP_050735673.1 XK-related protein 4-like [Eriocheir sinensis]
MPLRDYDSYVTHQPKSSRSSSSSSRTTPQFTWLECVWMTVLGLSYLMGYAIQISIIVERYSLEEPPTHRYFYVVFFLLPHLTAGLKNLQYHYRESMEEEGEDGAVGWMIHLLLLPFSPLIRFWRALSFGMKEKENWEYGIRFLDEMVTIGVLRLFEVFLGDGPTLVMLARDDVWGRSDDWDMEVNGPNMRPGCGPMCEVEDESPIDFWTVFRMLFLLSKMSQCITFYLVVVKRLQRLQHPEQYEHLGGSNARQGRANFFAVLLLYTAHFFFIGSRIMGWSMVNAAWGAWVYMIVGAHWLINTGWHLITVLNSKGLAAARSVSSLIMGAVWLIALTNEQGGRQLGRFVLYYSLAFVESAVCAGLWHAGMVGSGDFFAAKAPWALLTAFMFAGIAHIIYYAICHPGSPSISSRGLLCCSGNRWDPVDEEERA